MRGLEKRVISLIFPNIMGGVRIYYQSFSNNESTGLISLRFTNIVLTHIRSLGRVYDTDLVVVCDKEFDKVVAIVCR